MNYSECIENARTRIGNYCKACPECNGRACKNQMPGPGAKGIGDTAIRNYDKWKEIRVQMDTIVENAPVDTSLKLFGKEFKYPFFAGPVGAVNLHYGDCLNDIPIMIFWYRPVRNAELQLLPGMVQTVMSWWQLQRQLPKNRDLESQR